MDGSIALGRRERKALLKVYRGHPDPTVRRRAQIVLLLADGYAWSLIAAVLFCSTRTIDRWKRRYEQGGIAALAGERRGRRSRFGLWLIPIVVSWVTRRSPRDFGFLRSRWCCGVVVVLMVELYQVKVSPETVRRWLHRENLVWRRPRPVMGPRDPQREEKLRKLRRLPAHLPPDEIAVFQDEADINTNPKIGSMWMIRGQQAEIPTPGTNEKRYLAGSLNWRTGDLIMTEGFLGEGRNSVLFVRHLDDLRHHLRRYRKIHVICDNARFHDCRRVHEYPAVWDHRIELHFLPAYSPDTNPIERIWWHLHNEITRNHRCRTMDELLDLVFDWLENRVPFEVERDAYTRKQAA
ncbi:MAG: IS630 family transposase [Gemmatimonadales bacterium]